MKKAILLTTLAFTCFLAKAQQPSLAAVEAAKRDKLVEMLAKSGGTGSNQVTDAQPEQDCWQAITVCQTTYNQPNSYLGGGLHPDEINNSNSCLGAGELNTVWYKVVAAGFGNLGFNLTPVNGIDDYDWAVYDLTYNQCSDIFNNPLLEISCNFSGSTFPTAATGPNGGSNGQDEPLIPVIPGHIYYICVSNFSTTNQSGYTLDFSPSTIPIGNCAFVYGNVYYDADQNCQRNGNDFGMSGQVVYATPGPYYSIADHDGFYTMVLPLVQNATYYISSIPVSGELALTCPSPENYRTVTINSLDSVYTGNDFAYFGNDGGITPCPVIEVSNVSSVLLACCETNRYIQICNTGSAAFTGGTLTLNYLDNYVDPVAASLLFTENGNSIVMTLPTIAIGDCYNVWVTEAVIDSSAVGETACVEAVVGPVSPCQLPNNLWDGSNLIVTGVCSVDSVHFTIINNGIGNMQQSEVYELYDEINLVDNGTVTLQAGQSITLSYPATGTLLTMRVNQSDYNPNNSNPCSFISNCGPEMPPSQAYNMFALGDEPNYVDIDCNAILNSYDPNDKSAAPIGVGVQHFISPADEIQYKIRFQNMGTAPAYKVVIIDTLDANLDPATLRLGASSHVYSATLTGNGIITFTFNDIVLPPASVNEPGSMGVITYSVKQRWGLPINYTIENTAYIYFDLNPAIITNTVFHNVKDNTTGIIESSKGNIVAELYPNPAGNDITLKLNALKQGQGYKLQVFTATGALVQEHSNIKTVEKTIDVSTLSTGLYYYRVLTTDGKTAAGRFVKE